MTASGTTSERARCLLPARPLPVHRRVERGEGRAAEGDPVVLLGGPQGSARSSTMGVAAAWGIRWAS